MANYTTNIAQNPGFQLGTTGYSAVNNAKLTLGTLKGPGALFSNPGLLVVTPGVVSGEGVITFDSTIPGGLGTTFSFSIYIQGITTAETVTVYAVANPGGVLLASVPVQLTSGYQRVTLNNLNVGSATDLYLIISTTSVQVSQFWITNVQIEPETPAHAYCDGGQLGCAWTGGIYGSTSFQQYQNTLVATANNVNASNFAVAIQPGRAFNALALGDFNKNVANVATQTFAAGPVGAMTDFSVTALTDADPTQTYPSWNNAGAAVPTSGYTRVWGTFFPPQDYFVSGNTKLYSRGAFMAAGLQFSNVPNNQKVTVSDVQVEILPFTTGFGAPAPSNYLLPREIQTIITPTRLNYCPNPSFTLGISGWNSVGAAVLVQDPTVSVGTIVTIDDNPETGGTASMNVSTTNLSGDGASIQLTNLIAGDTYIVSAYVQADVNVTDIQMVCANGSTSAAHGTGGTGYGAGTYGGGFYGGNPPSNTPLPTGQWFRIFTVFQPTDSVATLTITDVATAPTDFWIGAVLVEAGQVLSFYFDGSFGKNYFWEGVAGLSRSYFYDEFGVKSQAIINVLQHHTPLGISYAPPLYNTPPTQ